MTQGSAHSALSRIEESYCVGDVIIASTAVIGSGVVLRADPGCSITVRDGVCIGSGVIIHATEGSLELKQGVCLAGGVLIIGKGYLGQNSCIGAGSTLISPALPEGSILSGDSLWGDESRNAEPIIESDVIEEEAEDISAPEVAPENGQPSTSTESPDPWIESSNPEMAETQVSQQHSNDANKEDKPKTSTPAKISKQVIGIQQFEMMVHKMFPDREAFRKSQQGNNHSF